MNTDEDSCNTQYENIVATAPTKEVIERLARDTVEAILELLRIRGKNMQASACKIYQPIRAALLTLREKDLLNLGGCLVKRVAELGSARARELRLPLQAQALFHPWWVAFATACAVDHLPKLNPPLGGVKVGKDLGIDFPIRITSENAWEAMHAWLVPETGPEITSQAKKKIKRSNPTQ